MLAEKGKDVFALGYGCCLVWWEGRLRDRKRMSAEERQVKSREVVSLELLDGRQEAAARPHPASPLAPARATPPGILQGPGTANHTSLAAGQLASLCASAL